MLLAFKGCLLKGVSSLLKQSLTLITASGMFTCHIDGLKIPIWKRFPGAQIKIHVLAGLLENWPFWHNSTVSMKGDT